MSALATKKKMLYCPKCKSKYEDGNQRFCDNDGGRLLPEPTLVGGTKKDTNVFTNLLSRVPASDKSDEKLAGKPRFVKAEQPQRNFEPPAKSKVFKHEANIEPAIKGKTKSEKTPANPPKKSISSKLIQSSEVSVNQAPLGNREVSPQGRAAVSWQNPRVLLGETVKGRYRIADKLHQDQASIAYLAEDGISKGKRVIVRVLMSDTARDSFQDSVFSEERVSLSHVNHPNIVKVTDSGELPEGKPFIVTDFIEGKSVGDILRRSGDLNPMRTARIVRQSSLALSEIHQSGVLHRNLKPEHILLVVSEAGIEQVKVTDFAVSDGRPQLDNLAYKSPEQLGGELPTFASDSYSLAVIAFQMLTGKLPFNDNSERGFLKAQRTGLKQNASEIKSGIPQSVDPIFVKALSLNPADRYPKTRDFGEALFNALTVDLPREDEARFSEVDDPGAALSEIVEVPESISIPASEEVAELEIKEDDVTSDIHIASSKIPESVEDEEVTEEAPLTKSDSGEELWKNRSPEPVRERGIFWTLLPLLGLVLGVMLAVWAIMYFVNRDKGPIVVEQPQSEDLQSKKPPIEPASNKAEGDDMLPPERKVKQPPNTVFFGNSKDSLKSDLAKHFREFKIYYPNTWVKEPSDTNFLDIKKTNKEDLPEEQMIITYYESEGTYESDKPKFPKLVEKSNKDLGIIPNYKVLDEKKFVVNGYSSYAVEFSGTVPQEDRDDLEIWGRRIWVPVGLPGVQNGFVITMLATSLSDSVKGIEDVGQKGDLRDILKTFQPSRDYEN